MSAIQKPIFNITRCLQAQRHRHLAVAAPSVQAYCTYIHTYPAGWRHAGTSVRSSGWMYCLESSHI